MKQGAVSGVLVFLAACVAGSGCSSSEKKEAIRAYVVHHGKAAFTQLAQEFERQSGIHVETTFACRSELFEVVSEKQDGDVCVTTGLENIERFGKEGLSKSPPEPAGALIPFIEVVKGNPKKIASPADLARPGVRVVLGRSSGCLGGVADKILEKSKLTDKVTPNVVERVRGDRKVAGSVDGKKVDACIVWRCTTLEVGPERYESIPIPAEYNVVDPVAAVVLETGKNKAGAEKFMAFLRTEKAKKILSERGLR